MVDEGGGKISMVICNEDRRPLTRKFPRIVIGGDAYTGDGSDTTHNHIKYGETT